jgi:hypothetical protein
VVVVLDSDGENWGEFDEGSLSVGIGFDFPFYGGLYSNVNVCVNGILSFVTHFGSWEDVAELPQANAPALIAPFWADMFIDQGRVNFQSIGQEPNRSFVVTWEDALLFSYDEETNTEGESLLTFQVELQESGSIIFRYNQITNDGLASSPVLIGIQAPGGVQSLSWLFAYDSPGNVTNGLAVLFKPLGGRVVLNSYPNNSDSDGDGMPDGWEVACGFNPLLYADGGFDRDGDGLLNRDEYLSGTDPDGVLQAASLDVFNVIFYQPTRF